MSKSSKPTRYPGVSRVTDHKFRLRGRVRDPKTGKEIDLDRIVTAPTVHEANRIKLELLQELERAQPVTLARQRLRDFASSWLRSKLPTLKASTRAHYAEVLDNHVLPKLGDYYMDAIATEDLVTWRDDMYANGARPATVNSRLRVLKTVLRQALDEGLLARDITRRVPAYRETRSEQERNCLTAAELAQLLEKVGELKPRWYPFFATLAYTGLRFGEITSLRWDDIDEAKVLSASSAGSGRGMSARPRRASFALFPWYPSWPTHYASSAPVY